VEQRLRARQAADVGGENPISAPLHVSSGALYCYLVLSDGRQDAHRRADASLAPSASASSLAQASCGWTRPPSPQSVPASTFSRPTRSANRTIRSATSSGCSSTLVAWLTTP